MKNLVLKGFRAQKELSQEEMGKLLGMSAASYNMRENGRIEFTESEINSIIRILGRSYEDIFLANNLNKTQEGGAESDNCAGGH